MQKPWRMKKILFIFSFFDGILALNEHCFSIAGFIFIKCSCNDGMLIVAFTWTIVVCFVYWKGKWLMLQLPSNQHITYQLQYRKCGKSSCRTCRQSQGHGPYWYAYWREGSRLRSGYIGKVPPDGVLTPQNTDEMDGYDKPHSYASAVEEATPAMI